MRRGTDRHKDTQTGVINTHFAWLCLMQNVKTVNLESIQISVQFFWQCTELHTQYWCVLQDNDGQQKGPFLLTIVNEAEGLRDFLSSQTIMHAEKIYGRYGSNKVVITQKWCKTVTSLIQITNRNLGTDIRTIKQQNILWSWVTFL